MKKLLLFILLSMLFKVRAELPKGFATKDIFRSAVFMENRGMIDDYKGERIRYMIDHDNLTAFFTDKGIIYKLSKIQENKKHHKERKDEKKEEQENQTQIASSYVFMNWEGANPHPKIISTEKVQGYYTFLRDSGNTFKSLMTDGYKKLVYKDLYPGVDVEYIIPEKGGMEYSLIIHAGADISKVQMNYSGAVKSIKKDQQGNLIIHSKTGDIIEHTPQSFAANNTITTSNFTIFNNSIQFSFPNGYDKTKDLIIDPWVTVLTTLPPLNMGFDVDYDLQGNLFVYGAGGSYHDTANFMKVGKFDINGTPLWTFVCHLVAQNWSSYLIGDGNYPSNFLVDKRNGKTFIGQIDTSGTRIIRLTTNGLFDNFISASNRHFRECWDFAYNCSTNDVLALGGGTSSSLNMGVVNSSTGAVSTSNMTGLPNTNQDLVNGSYDPHGYLYVIINVSLSINNHIYKVNSAYNGYLWNVASGYIVFGELNNKPYYRRSFSNGYNVLAADSNYLYYYDSKHLKAFDLITGSVVGTPITTISPNATLNYGGIAVDACHHVYVGYAGAIKTFTFNGSTFTPGADINLGAAFTTNRIHDIKYVQSSNLLYVAGDSIVGVYVATLSVGCTPVTTLNLRVDSTCYSAIAIATDSSALPITFVWRDSLGNIVRQVNNSIDSTDTLSGVQGGLYTVEASVNLNCGGQSVSKSVHLYSVSVRNDTICAGQSALLTAIPSQGGGMYSWSPSGAITDTLRVTPATTSVYTVTYTLNSCPYIAFDTVTVIPIPTLNIDNDTICIGRSTTILATPSITGGSYSWSSGSTIDSIIVSPTTTSTYSVTYSVNGCSASITDTVTVNPIPILNVVHDTICAGQSATLLVSPSLLGGTYLWSPGGATIDSIIVSPSTTSTYSVTYTLNGCSVTTTDTVTVKPVPTIPTDNHQICIGQNTLLTATPNLTGGTFLWSLTGQITDTLTVSPSTTSVYTVTYTLNACSTTASDTVTINFPPTVSGIISPTKCPTDSSGSVVLTVIGTHPNFTYLWSNSNVNKDLNNVAASTYTVTITDAKNCTRLDTFIVTSPPPISIVPSITDEHCFGDSNGAISIVVSGGTSPYTFLWSNGLTTQNLINIPAATYSVIVTDSNLCKDTMQNIIVTEPNQLIITEVINPEECTAAMNGSIILTVHGGTIPYQYTWADNITTKDRTNLSAGFYAVTVTDAHHCTDTSSATITIQNTFALHSIVTNPSCPPFTNGSIQLQVTGNLPPYHYHWSNTATTNSIANLPVAAYSVTVTDSLGCTIDSSFTLRYDLILQLHTITAETIKMGDSLTLNTTTNGSNLSYIWTPSNGLNCDTCANPVAMPAVSTTYQVHGTTDSGCVALDTVTITVIPYYDIYIPNAFSPNNDGNNDFWEIYGNKPGIQKLNVKLFDRLGEKVFESSDINFKWDGRYKGDLVSPGVFVYVLQITFIDHHVENGFKGSVTVVR